MPTRFSPSPRQKTVFSLQFMNSLRLRSGALNVRQEPFLKEEEKVLKELEDVNLFRVTLRYFQDHNTDFSGSA